MITFTEAAAAELAARVRQGLEEALEQAADEQERDRIHDALSGLHRAHSRDDPRLLRRTCSASARSRRGSTPASRSLDDLAAQPQRSRPPTPTGRPSSCRGARPAVEIATEPRASVSTASRTVVDEVSRFRDAAPARPSEHVAPADIDGFVLELPRRRGRATGAAVALRGRRPRRRRSRSSASSPSTSAAPRGGRRSRVARARDPLLGARCQARTPARSALGRRRTTAGDRRRCSCELREATEEIQPAMRTEALAARPPARARSSSSQYEQRAPRRGDCRLRRPAELGARPARATAPRRATYFRERFTVILVDEFQDTDPVQAEIALLHRERRRARRELARAAAPAGRAHSRRRPEAVDLPLPARRHRRLRRGPARAARRRRAPQLVQNFRSTGGVIDWVNDVFDRVLVEAGRRAAGQHPARRRPTASSPTSRARSASSAASRPTNADEARDGGGAAARGDDPARGRAKAGGCATATPATSGRRRYGDIAILFPAAPALDMYLESASAASGVPVARRGRPLVLPAPGGARPRERARGDRRPARPGRARREPALERRSAAPTRRSTSTSPRQPARLPQRRPRTAPSRVARGARAAARPAPAPLARRRSRSSCARRSSGRGLSRSRSPAGTASSRPRTSSSSPTRRARSAPRGGGGLRAFARWLAEQRGVVATRRRRTSPRRPTTSSAS